MNHKNRSFKLLEGKSICLCFLIIGRDFLTEKIIMELPDEALGGNIVDEDGTNSPNSFVFPIHQYTNEGSNSTFVRTPDIPVPEQEEKKTGFFKKDKKSS